MATNGTVTTIIPGVPIYFETSWSILSSIGLYNVLIGFMVVGITNLSPVTAVPIVVSLANAIADGLCYYAFYAENPTAPTAVAAVFADFFWLIQEAGLSLYSYQILIRLLRGKDRKIFIIAYWILIFIVALFKTLIAVSRVQDILEDTVSRVDLIDHLHIGYFIGIALVEALSSYFLLHKFFTARRDSAQAGSKVGLFSYLTRSTEIRLAALTLVGITRAITYSFQTTAQSATTASGQLDRFVTTLECLFPIVMFIDILAAKSLVHQDHRQGTSSHDKSEAAGHHSSKSKAKKSYPGGHGAPQGVYSMNNIETRVNAPGAPSSSQERIVETGHRGESDTSWESDGKTGGINKTVEFVFHDSGSSV